jgi:hypothetical protein
VVGGGPVHHGARHGQPPPAKLGRIGIGGEAPFLVVIGNHHRRRTRLATFLFGVVANGLQKQRGGGSGFSSPFFIRKTEKTIWFHQVNFKI